MSYRTRSGRSSVYAFSSCGSTAIASYRKAATAEGMSSAHFSGFSWNGRVVWYGTRVAPVASMAVRKSSVLA